MNGLRNTDTKYRFTYEFPPVRGGLDGRAAVEVVKIEVTLNRGSDGVWWVDADAYAWNLTAEGKRSARQGGPRTIWNERFLVREYGLAAVQDALLQAGLDPAAVTDDAQIERRWTLEWAQL